MRRQLIALFVLLFVVISIVASVVLLAGSVNPEVATTSSNLNRILLTTGNSLATMNPDGSDIRYVPNAPFAVGGVDWSPDQLKITYDRGTTDGTNLYIAELGQRNEVRITFSGLDWSPDWSPDGRHIAFYTMRDGNAEIYVIDIETWEEINLTNHASHDTMPVWSSSGDKILFVSDRYSDHFELFTMAPDGSNIKLILDDVVPVDLNNRKSALSLDGKLIAFTSSIDRHLHIIDIEAKEMVFSANGYSPAWSADGTQFAYIESGNDHAIYIVNINTLESKRISSEIFPDSLVWSP